MAAAKLKDLVDALVSCCEDGAGSLDDCVSGLEEFFRVIENSPDLKRAVEGPVVPDSEKIMIVKDLCAAGGFSDVLSNFLAAAMEFGKLKALFARRRAVIDRLCSAGGMIRVTVTAARPFGPDDRERVKGAIRSVAGGEKSEVEFTEDSEIIGGMIVRIGNTVYDDSVKTHLAKMRAAISK
ncbi:ATP synthase delta subunit family protein [Candidatus Mycalebacterium sp.]